MPTRFFRTHCLQKSCLDGFCALFLAVVSTLQKDIVPIFNLTVNGRIARFPDFHETNDVRASTGTVLFPPSCPKEQNCRISTKKAIYRCNRSGLQRTPDPPDRYLGIEIRMDSSQILPSGTESAEAAPSSESPAVNYGDGNAPEDGVVGPPSAKKPKIDDGTNSSSVAFPSNEETTNDGVGNGTTEIDDNGDNTHLDSEELDYEEEDANSDDEALFQQILAMARAGRIPLDYLRAHGIHVELDSDDEDVEYPFEEPPKSIEDVAKFIQSEKCQRIMVLAG